MKKSYERGPESDYTKGPLHLAETGRTGLGVYHIYQTETRSLVARVTLFRTQSDGYVFAAAPQMLAMLESCLGVLGRAAQHDIDGAREKWTEARDMIDKARNEFQ